VFIIPASPTAFASSAAPLLATPTAPPTTRSVLPAEAPVAPGIDFAALGRRYRIASGHIRNAAMRAAFFAADDRTPITAELLAHAASLEMEAMGKVVGA
jgi:hypothetical protein